VLSKTVKKLASVNPRVRCILPNVLSALSSAQKSERFK